MARPDSKRTRILKTLCEHMEGINPTNGYDHDLRGQVRRGQAVFGQEMKREFLSVLEAPKPNDVLVAGVENKMKRSVTWDLLLQGVTTDKSGDLDAAHAFLAECELRLSEVISQVEGRPTHPTIFRLTNLANDVLIGHGIARPPTDKVSAYAFFYLPVTVKFTHDLTNPFGD